MIGIILVVSSLTVFFSVNRGTIVVRTVRYGVANTQCNQVALRKYFQDRCDGLAQCPEFMVDDNICPTATQDRISGVPGKVFELTYDCVWRGTRKVEGPSYAKLTISCKS
jgi:hypothetical protein